MPASNGPSFPATSILGEHGLDSSCVEWLQVSGNEVSFWIAEVPGLDSAMVASLGPTLFYDLAFRQEHIPGSETGSIDGKSGTIWTVYITGQPKPDLYFFFPAAELVTRHRARRHRMTSAPDTLPQARET
jgi:hypothetical protein